MHAVLGSRAALASAARPVSRVSTAPPSRHSRRRCSAPTCTATRAVADFALGSSVKVTKSAISKLAVAELRAECQRLGLPDDGLKPALVERVFSWLQQQGSQQQAQQKLQASSVRQQSAVNAVIDSAAASASRSTATALPGNVVSTPAPAAMAAQATAAVPAASSPVAMTRAPGAIGASDSSNGSSSLLQPGQQSKHSSNVRVTWLGTSSGSPTARRNVSAIAVRFDDDIFLVDCGEGTRNQLQRAELDPAAIRTITVTHMHGDHCFGVGGVIQAVCEARLGGPRQNETLHIWGPPELQAQVFGAVRMGVLRLTTPVLVTGFVLDPSKAAPPRAADPEGMLHFALQGPDQAARIPPAMAAGWQAAYDQGSERIVQQGLSWTLRMPTPGPNVVAAQLQHRVPCWGYVFQEEPQVVPPPATAAGAGTGSEVAGAEGGAGGQQWVRPGRKLVILGDTCNSSSLAPLAADCDLLSHEATFCSGMEDKAAVAQHSTTEQAGAFAAAVAARNLVLTHFSARYESMAVQPQQRRATDRPRPAPLTGVLGQELGGGEMRRLLEETQSTYGKDSIFLANDFFTFKVAPHAPVPAEELAAQQAQRQARAIEVTRAAQAAASATSGKREQQRYYSQQAGGGGGRQQGGYQQRRPGGGGGGGGGRSQQRRPRPAGQR